MYWWFGRRWGRYQAPPQQSPQPQQTPQPQYFPSPFPYLPFPPFPSIPTIEEEISMLEDYKEFLERELKAVEERIRALRKVLEGGG